MDSGSSRSWKVGTKHFSEPARAEVRIARYTPETSEGVLEDAQLPFVAV